MMTVMKSKQYRPTITSPMVGDIKAPNMANTIHVCRVIFKVLNEYVLNSKQIFAEYQGRQ